MIRAAGRPLDPLRTLGRQALAWALLGALVGLSVGVAMHLTTRPASSATVALELPPVSPELSLSDGRVNGLSIDTDAQLVLSDAVVAAAATAASRDVQEVRGALSITAPQLTRVIELTYADRSAGAAQAGAQAAGEALLRERARLVLDPVRKALTDLDRSTVQPVALGSDPSAATTEVTTSTGRQQAVIAAQLALAGPGTILTAAQATEPRRTNPEVPVASGVGAGALLGLLVGVLRRRAHPAGQRDERPARDAGAVRRRRTRAGSAALVGLLGLVAGSALATRVDARPVGELSFVLRPLPGNPFDLRRDDNSVELATEAQLAMGDAVLRRVVAAGGGEVSTLRSRVRVTAQAGSEVLVVSVPARTAVRAERQARQMAQAVLDQRAARAGAELARQNELLARLLAQTRAEYDRTIAAQADSSRASALAERLVTLTEDVESLPQETRAGNLSDPVVQQPGARAVLRRALPWAGLAAGLAVGVAWQRPRRRARRGPSAEVSSAEPKILSWA